MKPIRLLALSVLAVASATLLAPDVIAGHKNVSPCQNRNFSACWRRHNAGAVAAAELSAIPTVTQPRQGAIYPRPRSCRFASDGSCAGCQFLLLELTSFGDELRLDHFRNQIVLVAR